MTIFLTDATIRFTSEEYVVFESDGTVMLTVVISSGELGRDIHIRVQTISVTAQGNRVSCVY